MFEFLAPFSYFLFAIISTIITFINIQLKLKKFNPKKDIIYIPNFYPFSDIILLYFSFRKTKFKTFTLIRNSILRDSIEKNPAKLTFITHIYAFINIKLLIHLFKNNKNVIPGSDSIIIAKELEMVTQRNDVIVFPIYHNIKETNIPKKENKFIIFIPGGLTYNTFFIKGFDTIMATFKYIIKNNLYPLTDRITFMFQESIELHPIYNEFLKDLKKMKIEYIKEKSYPHEEEYNNFINQSDIIVLPYKLKYGYDTETSGVYIEAIIAKKNVITTRDSWMYHISKNKIKSNLFFKNNDHKDLAEKIIELFSNFSYYKAQTNNAKKVFEKIHNEENFFNCFFKKV